MGKGKKKNQEPKSFIVTAFILLVVSIGFVGGYEIATDLDSRLLRPSKNGSSAESSDIMTASKKGNMILGFDEKYVESNEDLDYQLSLGTYAGSGNAYFTLGYGQTKSDIVVTKYYYDNNETQEYTLNFAGNVVDVRLGQLKNDTRYNTIFYLLDNGDVCYTFVEDMVKDSEYGFYTTIESLSKIVKFYNGNSCNPNSGSCSSTMFAQKNDGTIYDLNNYIN